MKLFRGECVLTYGTDQYGLAVIPTRYRDLLNSNVATVVEKAVDELEQAANLIPDRHEAFYQRARGLRLLGRHEEAAGELENALAREPQFAPAVNDVVARGVNVVQIDRRLDAIDASSVVYDDHSGAYEATRHLIEAHNQPVYYIGFQSPLSSMRDHHQGWADAMRADGFFNSDGYFLDMQISVNRVHRVDEAGGFLYLEEAVDRANELFAAGKGPWSIFCAGDVTAFSVYRVAQERGLVIGRDVFVVGYDDHPMCLRVDPPLSSVSQDWGHLGHEAAALLYEMGEANMRTPAHRVLPVTIRRRQSSQKAKQKEEMAMYDTS